MGQGLDFPGPNSGRDGRRDPAAILSFGEEEYFDMNKGTAGKEAA
jgi:hypothetical protein